MNGKDLIQCAYNFRDSLEDFYYTEVWQHSMIPNIKWFLFLYFHKFVGINFMCDQRIIGATFCCPFNVMLLHTIFLYINKRHKPLTLKTALFLPVINIVITFLSTSLTPLSATHVKDSLLPDINLFTCKVSASILVPEHLITFNKLLQYFRFG